MRPQHLALLGLTLIGASCRFGYELTELAVAGGEGALGGQGGALGGGGGESGGSGGAGAGGSGGGGAGPASGGDIGTGAQGGMGGVPNEFGSGPFSPPTLVTEIGAPGAADDDPSFTDDRLELYFASNRSGMVDEIWVTKRLNVSEPWGTPNAVAELNSADDNAMPGVSADGLTLYFVRADAGMQETRRVHMSTRPSREANWGTPVPLSFLTEPPTQSSPSGTSDRLFLLLSGSLAGFGSEIWVTERATTADAWSDLSVLPGTSTTGFDGEPWISDSRLVLYSRREGMSGSDIVVATRASVAEPFGAAVADDSLNSPENDVDPWLSQDLRHVMFASDRAGGGLLIYEAFRE